MMNIFFQSFIWFFYVPMIEINLGMSFCGANSFLVAYRDENKCTEHPIILKFMGILCFLLTFLLCIVIIIFFRNYEFLDQNYLKKKYHWCQIIQTISRTCITIFYYSNNEDLIIWKHFMGHLLSISLVMEYIYMLPIVDHKVGIFYHYLNIIGWNHVIIASMWEILSMITDSDMFFMVCFISPFLCKIGYQLYLRSYDDFMAINFNVFENNS